MGKGRTILTGAFVLLLAFVRCSGAQPERTAGETLVVAPILDETGERHDAALLARFRGALQEALRAEGLTVRAAPMLQPAIEVRARLIRCWMRQHEAGTEQDCVGSVAMLTLPSRRLVGETAVRAPPGATAVDLGVAMGSAVRVGLHPPVARTDASSADIIGAGKAVRYLGGGQFLIDNEAIDLHAIAHAHDPTVDPDVSAQTNVTLNDVPGQVDGNGQSYAVITLYQVDPPLTGQPSREAGIDRGTDFRDPANLVKGAYTNYVSPVWTDDPVPLHVASHPIGHFFVKVEVPGYPTILTGMTTIARADTELVDLTLGRQLGIGGVLLTPEPGRLNSAAEVLRELTLRQRRLRVVDGLYFHRVNGRNAGPEYLFDDGRVVFLRVKLPIRNATDALAFFVEFVHRGEHNRFGSLANGPFKGTGAGCAAFAMSWLQAAGAIPFIMRPPSDIAPPVNTEELGPADFWRAIHAKLHIPWRLIGCDERVGAPRVFPAELTVYDLLFHNVTAGFARTASHGLAEQVRASYGPVVATLFQIGALSPLRDLVIGGRRKDPGDRGDYSWRGPGINLDYWDNSRFSAWIHRLWANGPRDAHIKLAREGRFVGIEIDATDAPRQREPLFAAADRLRVARSADAAPALSCKDVFERGLE